MRAIVTGCGASGSYVLGPDSVRDRSRVLGNAVVLSGARLLRDQPCGAHMVGFQLALWGATQGATGMDTCGNHRQSGLSNSAN